MAAGDAGIFDQFILDLGNKIHDLDGDTWKFGLVDNTDAASMVVTTAGPHWGGTGTTDFSTNQVSTAGGYTGPITLASAAWTDEGTTILQWDFANPSVIAQDGSGATDIYWGIIYNDTDTNKRAAGWFDLGGPVSLQAGSLTITFNANGLMRITA